MPYDGFMSANNPLNTYGYDTNNMLPTGGISSSLNTGSNNDSTNNNNNNDSGNGPLGATGAAWGLGLNTIGLGFGIYGGLKSLSLANKQFKLNKAIAQGNFNNNVKSYNTNLQTTAGLRSSMEGTGGPNSQAATDFYNQNKLSGV